MHSKFWILLLAAGAIASPGDAQASNNRASVCHRAGGRWSELSISSSARAGHLGHGDREPSRYYPDADDDGYGAATGGVAACSAPRGYVSNDDDCDDGDDDVHPGASETCDGIDDDCDGNVDEAVEEGRHDRHHHRGRRGHHGHGGHDYDEWHDEHGNDESWAGETYEDEDESQDLRTWYLDGDGDNYGNPATSTTACAAPAGYVADAEDCDDSNAAVNPRASESCTPYDDDCDGLVNEPDAVDAAQWYADDDQDGFGDATISIRTCDSPLGYVLDLTDCDDADASISPTADEVCDVADNDCDGSIDEEDAIDATYWYSDADLDGFGDAGDVATYTCDAPAGEVADHTDCDDGDPAISPDGVETCDLLDNDCDGVVDESDASGAPTWFADVDLDGFGDASEAAAACEAPDGYVSDAADCDDDVWSVNPDAVDTCDDAIDQDCSGAADEGCGGPAVACDDPGMFGVDGDLADIDLQFTDYVGQSVAAAGDLNGDTYGDAIAGGYGRIAVLYGAADGLLRAESFRVDPNSTYGGQRVIGGDDYNADGYDDILTSDYQGSGGEGHVSIFYGGASGVATTAGWSSAGGETGIGLGVGLTAGDFNGDGYPDIVAATRWGTAACEGWEIRAWYGNPTGLTASPGWSTCGEGTFLSGLSSGDVNGDGRDDLLSLGSNGTELSVYHGAATGLPASAQIVDAALSNGLSSVQLARGVAGDVNGDGFDDVFVADYETATGLYFLEGSLTGLQAVATWSDTFTSTSWFGLFTSVLGDLNGDGYAEVGTTDYTYTGTVYDQGIGYVLAGGPDGPGEVIWTGTGGGYGAELLNVASAGDMDGDGTPDVIVSQWGVGRLQVYLSSQAAADPTCPADSDVDDDGVPSDVDCDDHNALVGLPTPFYLDVDGDGHGVGAVALEACAAPAGYGADNLDCDDGDVTVYPGATERCDGYDSDCDGRSDYTQEVGACGGAAGVIDAATIQVGLASASGVLHRLPDIDGDGGDELVIGSSVYSYPFASGAASLASFSSGGGVGARSLGDLTGDGREDVGWTSMTGALVGTVNLLNGLPTASGQAYTTADARTNITDTSSTLTNQYGQPWDWLGVDIAAAGDVTGDQNDDLVIASYEGLYVVPGPVAAGSLTVPVEPTIVWGGYVPYLAGPLDLDGDGVNDVVAALGGCGIGGCASNGGASVFVAWGGEGGMSGSSTAAELEAESPATGRTLEVISGRASHFTLLANAGDTTGDGIDDLLVMDRANTRIQILALEHGRAGAIDEQRISGFPVSSTSNNQAGPIAAPIDLNGDDAMDLVVTKPEVDGFGGVLYAFEALAPREFVDVAYSPQLFEVWGTESQFGSYLAVGDYDGDGADDIATIDGGTTLYLLYPGR